MFLKDPRFYEKPEELIISDMVTDPSSMANLKFQAVLPSPGLENIRASIVQEAAKLATNAQNDQTPRGIGSDYESGV